MPCTPPVHGIRIRSLNMAMLGLALLLFCVILYTTFLIWKEYNQFLTVLDEYISWERATHQVHVGSDHLTEQSRLFTQTGEKKYADNYFYELHSAQSREKASEFLDRQKLHPEDNENLQKALTLSHALTTLEIYAMRLVAEAEKHDLAEYPPEIRNIRLNAKDRLLSPVEKRERGRLLLFDAEYLGNKNAIMGMLSELLNENLARTSTQQKIHTGRLGELLKKQRLMLVALCVLNILTFAMIIILIVKPMQLYLRCIKDDKMLEIIGAYEFRQLAMTYNHIFAIKERHDKMLQHKAEHDALTGLLNRTAFDSLEHLMACDPQPMALILADVDKFKEVNDNFGHETGDEALKKVARLLKHSFRSDDLVIRMGGDEFIVVLNGPGANYKKVISEKIGDINKTLQKPEQGLPALSISAGVAFSEEGFSDNLYKHADVALYKVKEAGRCGCQFYEDSENKDENV